MSNFERWGFLTLLRPCKLNISSKIHASYEAEISNYCASRMLGNVTFKIKAIEATK